MLESPPFLKASADKKGKKERRCEQSQRRSFLLKYWSADSFVAAATVLRFYRHTVNH
jgi:hypothetical protein